MSRYSPYAPDRPHRLLVLAEPSGPHLTYVPFCSCGWRWATTFAGLARGAARDHHVDSLRRNLPPDSVQLTYFLIIEEMP